MVNTVKFSQFPQATLTLSNNIVVGLSNGLNSQTRQVVEWTTAGRPTPPFNGLLGYNTDLNEYEFWDSLTSTWSQLASTSSVGVTEIFTGTGLTGGPITTTGTISLAPISAFSLLINNTSGTAVPAVTPLSTLLLSANNLSDLSSTSTARTNLGLAIGVNVEAWNHQLDLIAAGTWLGAASITTLGTITTGIWQGTVIGVPYGGTGDATFTPYSVICGGTSSTLALQSVASVGALGQVLTSQGAGALPVWSNTSGSGTVNPGLANQLAYYATGGTVLSGLTSASNGVLITSGAGVPSVSSTLPTAVQSNITGLGVVTSGTWQGSIIALAYGGTNANLTANVGGIIYSTASALAILGGTATANQVLLSGAASAPSWSTATYPSTTVANQILYSSATNTITGLVTANNAVLITSVAGIPSLSSTLPSAVQGNITTLGTITSGVWQGTPIAVPFGGTGNTTFTAYSVICAGTTATGTFQNVSGLGSTGQVLTSQGAGALPVWSSTGAGTVNPGTANELAYYATSGSTLSGLSSANNGVLITSGAGVPSISSTLPSAVQANITALGTIASGIWQGTPIALTYGGTNASLVASNGGIVYSSTTALAILNGTGTANQVLLSGSSAAPVWSTATYPTTTIVNQLLYSNATNTITGLTTAANGILVTDGSGVPSISSTLPTTVQGNITSVGTIATGVWNGTAITVAFGGTGNTTFTPYAIIAAGTTATGAFQNVVGVGASGQVLTSTGAGSLPTWQNVSGTGTVNSGSINDLAYYAANGNAVSALATANNGVLITSAGGVPSISTALPSTVQGNITSVGVVTAGTWEASIIALAYGGTNANLTANVGGIVYSTASALAILAGTGTANQVLLSGAAAAPTWSTATYPTTTAINQILYSNAANTITGLTTANNSILLTSAGGVPSLSSTLPSAVQSNITTLGTIGTGVWNGTPITVSFGGTGNTTFTPYAIIAAGTTATGAFQNVSGLGTSGFVLTSNGAGTLPTWQVSLGSGTVNSGTINDLAYYASSTNAVSPLGTANNGVLVTSSGGVPSISSTLPSQLIIPTPQINIIYDQIHDLPVAAFTSQVSAVNYFSIQASATGLPLVLGIGAGSSDSNVLFSIIGKGNAGVTIQGTTAANNATIGFLGEIIQSVIATGSAVSLTTATAKDLTSISLTAGDWDVMGNVTILGSSTILTTAQAWCSLTSATRPDGSLYAGIVSAAVLASSVGVIAPFFRVNVSVTTTVYVSAQAAFATGTASMSGGIYARRVR